ncbi:hypothetical protein ZHAS_00013085 [Anopheles sinensis]|uniref:Uncharacterized protein n=1 Tax=Anopheles sinensis TaxID=74873 RepID=A0A084W4J2_ANOSI|nr:hypothetical protein ZHAS_00013085 [Anopheles sinensis]
MFQHSGASEGAPAGRKFPHEKFHQCDVKSQRHFAFSRYMSRPCTGHSAGHIAQFHLPTPNWRVHKFFPSSDSDDPFELPCQKLFRSGSVEMLVYPHPCWPRLALQ